MSLEERVDLIASRMTLREPFIGSVFTRLHRKIGEKGTAWVDGKTVYFGREFCDQLNDEQLLFVALHEAAHVVLMHMWRCDGRNPKLFNVATDAVINRMLVNMGYPMPSEDGKEVGILLDWVDEEMSSEYVYRKLMENPPPEQQSSGGWGDGEGDEDSDGQGGGTQSGQGGTQGGFDASAGDLRAAPDDADLADMEATITTAAKMAKAAGSTNALVTRVIGASHAPKVPWSEVLRQVMTAQSRDDYTYRRFNRRLMSQGLYLPALHTESMGSLVVAVDTSGSISPRELDQIASEIQAICEDCRPETTEVVYCDMDVQHTETFQQGEEIKLHPKGGGGTRFKPVFDYVETMQQRPAVLIYLTDLCGDTDELHPPEFPVVWGHMTGYGASDVPFGQKVEIDI